MFFSYYEVVSSSVVFPDKLLSAYFLTKDAAEEAVEEVKNNINFEVRGVYYIKAIPDQFVPWQIHWEKFEMKF